MSATDTQEARELDVVRHALGLDRYGQRAPYRNRFVTGPGSQDFETCSELARRGLMIDHGPHVLCGGSHCFSVTPLGQAWAEARREAEPKLTRSQRRYRAFLDADTGLTFGEWLGISRRREIRS